jgi:crotonobetainyl-CoA:carnitine CoA-transferase CaiB-like acyl-CoA transferase
MSLPFPGVRVLDLTSVIAGPYCTYQLAQMGAEVIKLEQPGVGDAARRQGADPDLNARNMGASFLGLNAGKRFFALNLKEAAGKAVFRRLAASADVLVENFRPGVMERLGLGYEALRGERPGLIYCAISGFGQEGSYRDKPAYDQIVQGLSGAMAATGDANSGPLRAGYPVCDTVAGLNAAFAIAAALYQRGRDGAGQFIDVSMLDATISAMGWATSNCLIAGQTPLPMGNDNFSASPSGSFRAADGLINVAANMQAQFEALCRAVGRPELIDDPRFPDPDARIAHRAALKAALEEALAERPGEEWVERFNAAGIPAGPVLSLERAVNLPPVKERHSVHTFAEVPGLERPIAVYKAGWRLSGGAPRVGTAPAPPGSDSEEVLAALGYRPGEIEALRRDGVI